MKTPISHVAIPLALLLISVAANAQQEQLALIPDYARYAVRFGEGLSPSGHGFNYSFDISVERLKKSLYFGLFLDKADGKLSGLNIRYKHYLNPSVRRGVTNPQGRLVPYVGYKLAYRMEDNITAEPLAVTSATGKKLKSSSTVTGRASSLEHMLDAGLHFQINSRVIFDCSAGIGYFIGDLMRDGKINFVGYTMTNSGIGFNAELGIVVVLFN